ncbi:MAG TPA: YraN family protein [Puia sp.]|nr:YraN family protein [Puia sp.]
MAQSKAKMAAHNEFGKAGEQMAAEWLVQHGFQLISRNWKFARYEVDIIASRDGILHFIEVKSRHDDVYGKPEDWVSRKKGRHLLTAGEAFQDKYPVWNQVQYDILSILLTPDGKRDFFFIEDVYWW